MLKFLFDGAIVFIVIGIIGLLIGLPYKDDISNGGYSFLLIGGTLSIIGGFLLIYVAIVKYIVRFFIEKIKTNIIKDLLYLLSFILYLITIPTIINTYHYEF